MAFTGTATLVHVSDTVVRITGLSLGIGAAGTIGLRAGGAAEVDLNVPTWNRYKNAYGNKMVELDSSVECRYCVAAAGLAVVEPLSIVKTGNGPTDLLITLTNPDAAASGALEIYVEFHGS